MKVLIVEDDHAAAFFFAEVAKTNGYEDVDIAETAEDALAMAINTTYDLITLDVQLPGASGLEILSVIRNMSSHAIIAIISGHLPDDIPPETNECADVVIRKPCSVQTLSTLMNSSANIHAEMEIIRQLEHPQDQTDSKS